MTIAKYLQNFLPLKRNCLQSTKCVNDKTQQVIHGNGGAMTCFKREELVDIMLHVIADILDGTL